MKLFKCSLRAGCLIALSACLLFQGCKGSKEVAKKKNAAGVAKPQSYPLPWTNTVFETPVRILADGAPILIESPGYACPTMADVDGDGKLDLVVGQYSEGKMNFFRNLADVGEEPRFAKGEWIMSGSEAAVVPGVW